MMATKKLSATSLADLVKRVPKNQMKQFEKFRDKTLEYHRRVNQYPDKVPQIDWDYYRNNVRKDFVAMVEEFQGKYEEFDRTFSARHEIKDFAKYYDELDKLTEVVKGEVKEFIESSNSRIKIYESEIKRLRDLLPYDEMTVEQFVVERADVADYIPRQGKPLFWPHVPSEQGVGSDYEREHGKGAAGDMKSKDKKTEGKKESENSKETPKKSETDPKKT